MSDEADSWQAIFFASAAIFIAYQMFRGWRLGVVRQLVNLFALILAYGVAIFGGTSVVPVLRPLGYPDFIVSLVAGSIMASLVFASISFLGRILFRRTNQQGLGLLRLGYGVGGSFIGMVFGFLTVWLVVLAIRLLGTVAATEASAAEPAVHKLRARTPAEAFSDSIVHMKSSLEQGTAGEIVQRIDPLPAKVYKVAQKVGLVASNADKMQRFLSYPGARELALHPRIVALQRDPAVTREVASRNYLGLMKNESVVRALDDPEVTKLVRNFELEKALDYALQQ